MHRGSKAFFLHSLTIESPQWTTRRSLELFLLLVAIVLFSTACVREEPGVKDVTRALKKLSPGRFPDFSDDLPVDSLQTAINESIRYLKRLDPAAPFRFGSDSFTTSHMIASLEAFSQLTAQSLSSEELRAAIAKDFWVYKAAGQTRQGRVLFTGYYEPVLQGALRRSSRYPYPIYRKPDDWVAVDLAMFDAKYGSDRLVGRCIDQTVTPYFSRQEIDARGALRDKGYELAWVSDVVDLFFLHIQGSGRIMLDDGTVKSVNYHCDNGRPYTSIGKLLIDDGIIPKEEMSMDGIRSYLKGRPEDIPRIFNSNERYVFFRFVDDGPLGAMAIPLTPGRSVATDLGLFPKGALAFIDTEKPLIGQDGAIQSWQRFGRFVLNQDTGAAIQGPGRVDMFFGDGRDAEVAAGHMKHEGMLFFLVKKPPPAK
jgi:membrane-bound lytic murein transglycosylase A